VSASRARSFGLWTAMAFGYAFLYVPMLAVVAYSFNESRLVTVWGGFSTRWYGTLLGNAQILEAAARSLGVAALAATFAVVLGTASGYALARFARFRGRGLLSLMTSAPLVMPDVMLGLSALLLFVTLQDVVGWPATRGVATITIAHVTFCVGYVTVVVRSRLTQMDLSLEEAAMDLGARPWRVFASITLPLIAPALVAGWLLAFTLSLDDLVVASFTSGPGASTLPMVIYSKVKLGVTPEINALATLLILAVTVGVVTAAKLLYRRTDT
jgi:putrescine transport system permease protein